MAAAAVLLSNSGLTRRRFDLLPWSPPVTPVLLLFFIDFMESIEADAGGSVGLVLAAPSISCRRAERTGHQEPELAGEKFLTAEAFLTGGWPAAEVGRRRSSEDLGRCGWVGIVFFLFIFIFIFIFIFY
jgi:hypothetical protein